MLDEAALLFASRHPSDLYRPHQPTSLSPPSAGVLVCVLAAHGLDKGGMLTLEAVGMHMCARVSVCKCVCCVYVCASFCV